MAKDLEKMRNDDPILTSFGVYDGGIDNRDEMDDVFDGLQSINSIVNLVFVFILLTPKNMFSLGNFLKKNTSLKSLIL